MKRGKAKPAAGDAEQTRKAELSLSSRALAGLARDILEKGRRFRFKARGHSMYPFIRDGDILTLSPAPADTLTVGDVAAVTHPETRRLVIHRVTKVTKAAVIIQGDNARSTDDPIPRVHILGRVTRVERNGRTVSLGFGPERVVIPRLAKLRHRAWLRPLLKTVRSVIKP